MNAEQMTGDGNFESYYIPLEKALRNEIKCGSSVARFNRMLSGATEHCLILTLFSLGGWRGVH